MECWGISIDRSCHIGPTFSIYSIKLLRFELSVGYPIYQKDVQSNLFLDSIEAHRSEYGTQITIDMSKAGPITPIPNPK